MKKKRVRKIQTLYYHLLKPFGWLIAIFKYHYKVVNRYKLAKGERAVLLSNHQTDLDPVFCFPDWGIAHLNRGILDADGDIEHAVSLAVFVQPIN